MDRFWIILLSIICLLFIVGYIISTLERNTIIENWSSRRCGLPVMVASRFFKPDSDPRTPSEFSNDNFEFCMKSYVDKFMALLMKPINAIFGKQVGVAGNAMGMMGTLRTITQTVYNAFASYLDGFYRKYHASIFQMNRIIQHIRMAVQRIGAIAMSMIFAGITAFRGFINAIQFIIKVILVVCGIMLAIIMILFFVLFPVIPIILAALTAVVYTTLGLSTIIGGSIGDTVNNMKSGFCFSEGTMIYVKTEDGIKKVPVEQIKLGDELHNSGKITAIILMDGTNEALYNVNGVYLSGSHVVKGDVWNAVVDDKRSKKTSRISKTLYCFNTTTNCIPVYCPETNDTLICRDWEEIGNDDIVAQSIWNDMVLYELNKNSLWKNHREGCDVALFTKNTLVKTEVGFVPMDTLKIADTVLDRNGNKQIIRGVVLGTIENVKEMKGAYHTDIYEERDGIWIKGKSTFPCGEDVIEGIALITENGEMIIWENAEKYVRDFTEIGYKSIYKTYSFVEHRLNRTPE